MLCCFRFESPDRFLIRPQIRYAKIGVLNIAHQIVGDGPFERLASFSRLIVFVQRRTRMRAPLTATRWQRRILSVRGDSAWSSRADRRTTRLPVEPGCPSSMYIISGDHETPTRHLAVALGIEQCFAETLPEDKASLIEELQQSGKIVCYVGTAATTRSR